MKLQFNGEPVDIPALQAGLIAQRRKIISTVASRWLSYDEAGNAIDNGGRIDIEVEDAPLDQPAADAYAAEFNQAKTDRQGWGAYDISGELANGQNAYDNWATLTNAQKDAVLKRMLYFMLIGIRVMRFLVRGL